MEKYKDLNDLPKVVKDEILYFMKENMDRWNKIQEENKEPEFKVGDIVTVINSAESSDLKNGYTSKILEIKEGRLQGFKQSLCVRLDSHLKLSWESVEGIRLATPEEIEEYNNKFKTFKMTSTSGDFELEVSKKGIYYRPEDTYLQPKSILEMCRRRAVFNGKNYTMPTYEQYDVKYETVKVGCKYGCSIQQFQEVYDYYKSLQK